MTIHHSDYTELLKNNKQWVAERLRKDPKYFEELALSF